MLATAVLAAQYAGTLDLLDTTTVRARGTQQKISAPAPGVPAGQTTTSFGFDFATTPAAGLRVADRHWEYILRYSPVLTIPDVQQGFAPQLLHFANASVAWHDRVASLRLSEGASYGQLNSAFLYQAPTLPGQTVVIQPVPVATTLYFGSSSTDLTLGLRAGRHVQLAASGGYFWSAGLDTNSRTYLPIQYGPRAKASLEYAPSDRDDFVTLANGQEVSTTSTAGTTGTTGTTGGACPPPANAQTCHIQADIVQLQETARRRWSRTTTVSAGGGIAEARIRSDADRTSTYTYPVALASLSYRFGAHGTREFTVSAQLAPFVDVRTGLVSERTQANAMLTDLITPTITLHAVVGAVQTVPTSDPYAVSILTGGVDVGFLLSRPFTLTIGEQGLWQDQAGYGTLVSVFTYAALTIHAPVTHF